MTTDPAKIIAALGLNELPEADQEETLLSLGDLAFKGSLIRLIEAMDDAARDEFNELLSKDPSEEQVAAFIKEKVPSADALVQEAVDEISGDILAGTP